jgi:predicted nuclease with TOPRIM domain
MENEGRIVELLAESLIKFDQMIDEQKKTNVRLDHVEIELKEVKSELKGVKKELAILNVQTVENTRAIFKLAENVEKIADLDKRVKELEKVVFK